MRSISTTKMSIKATGSKKTRTDHSLGRPSESNSLP